MIMIIGFDLSHLCPLVPPISCAITPPPEKRAIEMIITNITIGQLLSRTHHMSPARG